MKRVSAVRTEALSLDEVVAAVSRPEAGAVTSFSGLVRNHADGRAVTLLEYEAYPSMAEKEMERILEAIEDEIPEARLAVLHRIGKLRVGELAVVCAASAPHREQAFEACRQCIDRIKATVPIWKREHGPEGPYWVGWHDARCAHGASGHHAHGSGAGHAPSESGHHHAMSSNDLRLPPLSGMAVGVLTVSDSRSPSTDASGRVAREALTRAGATIVAFHLVRDEPADIASWVAEHAHSGQLRALVITGGTGIAERDRTIEALEPLFSRTLDGFGEAFRRSSFDQVGPRAMLSRAKAGVIGSCLVFALPGSPRAVELALTELVVPVLPHAVALLQPSSASPNSELIHAG